MGIVLLVLFTGKRETQCGLLPFLNNIFSLWQKLHMCKPRGLMQMLNNEWKYYVAEPTNKAESSAQLKLPIELGSYYKLSQIVLVSICCVYLYDMCRRKPFGYFTRCSPSPWKYLCRFHFLHSLSFCLCLHLTAEISAHHCTDGKKKTTTKQHPFFFFAFKIWQT